MIVITGPVEATEIHKRLLSAGAMDIPRARLLRNVDFFTHETAIENLDSIRKEGLRISPPNCNGWEPDFLPNNVGREILCLGPSTSFHTVKINKKSSHIRFALSRCDLPDKIIPDWSYPELWNAMKAFAEIGLSDEKSFVKAALTYGSVACLSGVSAEFLRVCTSDFDLNSNPVFWPKLSDVTNDAVNSDCISPVSKGTVLDNMVADVWVNPTLT